MAVATKGQATSSDNRDETDKKIVLTIKARVRTGQRIIHVKRTDYIYVFQLERTKGKSYWRKSVWQRFFQELGLSLWSGHPYVSEMSIDSFSMEEEVLPRWVNVDRDREVEVERVEYARG